MRIGIIWRCNIAHRILYCRIWDMCVTDPKYNCVQVEFSFNAGAINNSGQWVWYQPLDQPQCIGVMYKWSGLLLIFYFWQHVKKPKLGHLGPSQDSCECPKNTQQFRKMTKSCFCGPPYRIVLAKSGLLVNMGKGYSINIIVCRSYLCKSEYLLIF